MNIHLVNILEANPKAKAIFLKMPASHQREYLNYIAEAKKEVTQKRRAEKVMEMLMKK